MISPGTFLHQWNWDFIIIITASIWPWLLLTSASGIVQLEGASQYDFTRWRFAVDVNGHFYLSELHLINTTSINIQFSSDESVVSWQGLEFGSGSVSLSFSAMANWIEVGRDRVELKPRPTPCPPTPEPRTTFFSSYVALYSSSFIVFVNFSCCHVGPCCQMSWHILLICV